MPLGGDLRVCQNGLAGNLAKRDRRCLNSGNGGAYEQSDGRFFEYTWHDNSPHLYYVLLTIKIIVRYLPTLPNLREASHGQLTGSTHYIRTGKSGRACYSGWCY
jgi:hypothetical protein